jgi:hypothetical protein
MTLSVVKGTELGRGLVETGVGRCTEKKMIISIPIPKPMSGRPFPPVCGIFFFVAVVRSRGRKESGARMGNFDAIALTENGATALPLVADNATHGDCLKEYLC